MPAWRAAAASGGGGRARRRRRADAAAAARLPRRPTRTRLPAIDDHRRPPSRSRTAPPVPQGRTTRLLHFGRAVGELAAGAAAEGLSRLARGQLPGPARDDADARRTRGGWRCGSSTAARRGDEVRPADVDGRPRRAAAGSSPNCWARLRDRAQAMPPAQLSAVMQREYGPGWQRRFARFELRADRRGLDRPGPSRDDSRRPPRWR
ncbi:MAG: hypothetical protein MZW92_45570 [Comamonadaceae bacterium]|nr:hypothetical protein [Comamonadaceae bacterium]